ncbi:MAG: amidohydrolase family protein [Bacillota bacterium]|nr:amidohydrolase family protein [Bacillota bacterium]
MLYYDLVIKNAAIVDLEKGIISKGSIGINSGKISIIINENMVGKDEIDAKGNIVCPGFIDVHGHIDGHLNGAELSVLQGVTTTVGGNCGCGPIDLKSFFREQDEKGFLINQAQFIGHSFSLRGKVGITSPYVAASEKEINQMCQLAEKAFNEGAIGLSFGLEYAPGSSFEEVIALSQVAAKYNKLISIHTRLSAPDDLESLKEAVKISKMTGAAVLVSHFVYQYGTGIMTEALEIVDCARRNGINIWIDSGMYTSFATSIGTSVYDEEHIRKFGWKLKDMLVATGKYKGRKLDDSLYKELRQHHGSETVICFTGVEEEIYEALLKDYAMLSSDADPCTSISVEAGHPQNAGTFPRLFHKMVREKGLISLVEAVRKCTLLPATVLGLKNKGRMCVGADADLVVFNEKLIKDTADFLNRGKPNARPEGIEYVIVNGEIVVEKGNLIKGVLPGKPLPMNEGPK